jgi:hypothetical protein
MSLPLSILNRFNSSYDGFQSAVFNNSTEYHNFATALKEAQVSFKTKITKHKKRGREFVILLVNTQSEAA